jgi:hypothetical protein
MLLHARSIRPVGFGRWAILSAASVVLIGLFLLSWNAARRQSPRLGVSSNLMLRDTYPKVVFSASVTNLSTRPMRVGMLELHIRTEGGSEGMSPAHNFYDTVPGQPVPPGAVRTLQVSCSEIDAQARLRFEYWFDPDPVERVYRICLGKLGLRTRPRHTYDGPWVTRVPNNQPVDLDKMEY